MIVKAKTRLDEKIDKMIETYIEEYNLKRKYACSKSIRDYLSIEDRIEKAKRIREIRSYLRK